MTDRLFRPSRLAGTLVVPAPPRVILPSETLDDERRVLLRRPTVTREFGSLDEIEAFLDGGRD